jgi:hypothetical protein
MPIPRSKYRKGKESQRSLTLCKHIRSPKMDTGGIAHTVRLNWGITDNAKLIQVSLVSVLEIYPNFTQQLGITSRWLDSLYI